MFIIIILFSFHFIAPQYVYAYVCFCASWRVHSAHASLVFLCIYAITLLWWQHAMHTQPSHMGSVEHVFLVCTFCFVFVRILLSVFCLSFVFVSVRGLTCGHSDSCLFDHPCRQMREMPLASRHLSGGAGRHCRERRREECGVRCPLLFHPAFYVAFFINVYVSLHLMGICIRRIYCKVALFCRDVSAT